MDTVFKMFKSFALGVMGKYLVCNMNNCFQIDLLSFCKILQVRL